MCDVNPSQIRKEMPIILKGWARAYFMKHMCEARRSEEAIFRLLKRKNNHQKKYLLLGEWKEMLLSREMKYDPDASERDVFKPLLHALLKSKVSCRVVIKWIGTCAIGDRNKSLFHLLRVFKGQVVQGLKGSD